MVCWADFFLTAIPLRPILGHSPSWNIEVMLQSERKLHSTVL
jgi:hypothetical protein